MHNYFKKRWTHTKNNIQSKIDLINKQKGLPKQIVLTEPRRYIRSTESGIWIDMKCSEHGVYNTPKLVRKILIKGSGCVACNHSLRIKKNREDFLNKFNQHSLQKKIDEIQNGKKEPRQIILSDPFYPQEYQRGAHVKIKCQKHGDYKKLKSVKDILRRGNQCKECGVERRVKKNTDNLLKKNESLLEKFPHLKEYWSDKNDKNMSVFLPRSNKKVWWKCKLGHPDYLMRISHKTADGGGSGCPKCVKIGQSSKIEIRIYSQLVLIFGEENIESAFKINNSIFDIFIKPLNLLIEVDGKEWHKDSERDIKKQASILENYQLLRLRDNSLEDIHSPTIFSDIRLESSNIIIKKLCKFLLENFDHKPTIQKIIIKNIQNPDLGLPKFNEIMSRFPLVNYSESLKKLRPDLIKFWSKKNKNLNPSMLSPHSRIKVWWICEFCKKNYIRPINQRIRQKIGCNECSIKKRAEAKKENFLNNKIMKGFNLKNEFPDIAKEYDLKKNKISSSNIAPSHNKKVWWICSLNNDHKWEASPWCRTSRGDGCPYCSGRITSKENSVLFLYPQIKKIWDFKKNKFKPNTVSEGSNKIIHFKCNICSFTWKQRMKDQVDRKNRKLRLRRHKCK